LRAGEALQRFWLTATRLGLALQPGMAAVIFGFYGRHAIEFTGAAAIRRKAAALAADLDRLCPGNGERLVFMGRLGQPASRQVGARSVRRPLEELLVPSQVRHETGPSESTTRDATTITA
ncbi:MAG: hypothetical protein WCF16_08210, partial [Alphaproteobacteria bacterium]